jgi:monoamine oxidase
MKVYRVEREKYLESTLSGIGASTILTDNNKKHLIIEARDRIGGRIGKGNFSGITIDIGANFIHSP